MPVIKITRTEHYKIADYSFIEIQASVEEEFEDKKRGLTECHNVLAKYCSSARDGLKKAFNEGEFDL